MHALILLPLISLNAFRVANTQIQNRFTLYIGKSVGNGISSHYDVSRFQCASLCQRTRELGGTCNSAGYDELSRTCTFSNNTEAELKNTSARTSVVMVAHEIQTGNHLFA